MNHEPTYIIENIDFSMSMEDMPLTAENKEEMQQCLDGILDLDELIEKTIGKYTETVV
ncbi:MAG: hypothetical protein FWB78_02285 [Treponema sp.]|nr:hypothetical protein [Treponema sp.]